MKNIGLHSIAMALLALIFMTSCNQTNTFDSVDEMIENANRHVGKISVEDLKIKYDAKEDYYLIDVREANEHNFGYIPTSYNLSGGTILFRIDEEGFWTEASLYPPEKDQEIILYCKKGRRSVIVAYQLKQLGYTNVKYLIGGWKAWELAYPLLYKKDLKHVWEEEVEEVGGC